MNETKLMNEQAELIEQTRTQKIEALNNKHSSLVEMMVDFFNRKKNLSDLQTK